VLRRATCCAGAPRPIRRADQVQTAPERFRAKWIPVRVKKTRQNKTLDVGFQEVVHLVRTEEAEVAKLQCSTERPDEQPQECFPDGERSRGHGAVCGSGTEQCDRAVGIGVLLALGEIDRYERDSDAFLSQEDPNPP